MIALAVLGTANVFAQESTINVKGFGVEEAVLEGEDVIFIDFDVTSVIKLYEDSTYYMYNKAHDYYSEVVFNEDFTTDESTVLFVLDKESYNTFLIEGVGSIDLGNGNVYYFDDKFSNTIGEFLALKSTALRAGETIEG